ncbi:MAG TPA: pitrilysin family protein [Sideroxyarcus sp.]|nr:pitrilysin family protein [Sideroxyarcus sp.]
MHRAKFLLAWTVCLALLVPVLAQTKQSAAPPAKAASAATKPAPRKMTIAFKEYKLKNGLKVILSEDHAAPTYSLALTYNVGSRDERPGRTGFAHLFEHMMFQGSQNIGKGEHMLLVENNGGSFNGSTNEDRTNYFETLPANQLDLGLFLESDRMRALAITPPNLENQRNTVQEERRLGVDNQPYGQLEDVLPDLVYDSFPYKHSVIGSMADLNAATLQDVQDFFRIYYAPNNAVLTLVGDFKTDEALAKIKKYFEDIPAQPQPQAPDMTEPKQNGERRKTIDDNFAPTPQIDIIFKIPAGNTPDNYALKVLGQVLSSGRSSRLYQLLVKDKELVSSVGAYAETRRGPSLFQITANVRPDKDLGEVEKLIYAELDKLKTIPITDQELAKVRMMVRRSQAMRLQSTMGRAIQLGQSAVYFNDPNLINTEQDKINAATKADVQRVANAYLNVTNRTVIVTMPKATTAKARAPAQPGL